MTWDVAGHLRSTRERIARACAFAGRDPATVTLVAVSKTHGLDAVRAAHAAGQRVFGESYAQELSRKAEALRDLDIEWRMIGHLQRNKVKLVVGAGAAIDSVDSPRLASAIARRASERGATVRVCLQVNLAGEVQKSGVAPADVGALAEHVRTLPSLELRGLMAVPPADEDPRPYFRALRELARRYGLPDLSMGMSGDLEVAIEEGATMVRAGTAIFGSRGVKRAC